ncbi:dTDP-4-dehydrorhamnose reductase [Microbulbifer aestuariivivens]|uniref:dTDP-4-dehydrorhamnose reductase n=1 Tax=Microbulbifer aestuariivivens TaxID=1908308 RepID=A0ABP9WP90_9GAMM
MNILVTGASGLLGRSVLARLQRDARLQATGCAFSRAGDGLLALDLNDRNAVNSALDTLRPRLVIHCAAERWPDRCAQAPERSWQLNVAASEALARQCEAAGAQLAYISTDYVFDGNAPPYAVDNTPNPLNFYGRSKLAGERAVLGSGDHWVLRLPLLFGPAQYPGESGVTGLLETLQNRTPQAVDYWAIRFPTCVEEVADVLAQILSRVLDGATFHGIYHWSGDSGCTRYELAQKIADITGLDSGHLHPDSAPRFEQPRPRNCQLDKSRLTSLGIRGQDTLERQLARALAPLCA